MSIEKIIITDENNNEYYPTTSSDIVYMNDGTTLENKMNNHTHSQYLTEVPSKINKSIIFENDNEALRIQPSNANASCYQSFYKDKSNRSSYIGLPNLNDNDFVIANEIADANINLKTKSNGKVMINNNNIYHEGNKPEELNHTSFEGTGSLIRLKPANVNSAFFLEFFRDKVNRSAYLGYGNSNSDEFRIYNTASGAHINFVTTGTGKVMINNRVIYHEGNKPTPNDIGASPSNHIHNNYFPLTGGIITGSVIKITGNQTYYASYLQTLQGNVFQGNYGAMVMENNAVGRIHLLNASGEPATLFAKEFTPKTILSTNMLKSSQSLNNKSPFDILSNISVLENDGKKIITPVVGERCVLDENSSNSFVEMEVLENGDTVITNDINSMIGLLTESVKELYKDKLDLIDTINTLKSEIDDVKNKFI